MVPAVLLGVYPGLELGGATGRPAAATRCQLEALLLQHVKRLFDERVLKEETRSVTVGQTVVGVARFIQRLTKHVTAERHLTAHQDPRQLAELDVGETVAAEREAAAVADGDASLLAVRRARVGVAYGCLQARQPVVSCLAGQSLVLAETLRQYESAVAQVVQHVTEEHAVTVKEDATAGVARVVGVGERYGRQRVRLAQQRDARARVVHAADVQLEHLGRRVRHGWMLGTEWRRPRLRAPCSRAPSRPREPAP